MADLEAAVERFWRNVDRSTNPAGCHEWQGVRGRRGYGQFRYEGRKWQAHRWILGVHLGSALRWDDEVHELACHTCDNPPCCNLDHLFVGTHQENMADCARKGRRPGQELTHCLRGHEFTPENTYRWPTGRRCIACRVARDARRYQRSKALRNPAASGEAG